MGKKTKKGKQRKDKFYHLAKETGFRARSAFKLIQLNRKFAFLERSRVLVDLCAAPGGWMQVAQQNMPMSSLIVGVDLVGIKNVHTNCISIQNDITTDACRREIEVATQGQPADVVLHDGAPNVGQNWLQDAFSQAQLVLHALRLATKFLRKGGWFVTKIFRSKDHPALLVVFNKLFTKVHVTKPQASRNESAEIFAVCSGYIKPKAIDPALLDPKSVFRDLQLETEKPKLNILHPEKRKKTAEGYDEGDLTVYHTLSAADFIESDNFVEQLGRANSIRLDGGLDTNPRTTPEVKACLDDIQVLGRRELRLVLEWRKGIREELLAAQGDGAAPVAEAEELQPTEEEKIEEEIAALQHEEKQLEKRKKRKVAGEKAKRRREIELEMVHPGDRPDFGECDELFDLKRVASTKRKVEEGEMELPEPDEEPQDLEWEEDAEGAELAEAMESGEMGDSEGMVVSEETGLSKSAKAERRAGLWFERTAAVVPLDDDEEDDDEDFARILDRIKARKAKEAEAAAAAEAGEDAEMAEVPKDIGEPKPKKEKKEKMDKKPDKKEKKAEKEKKAKKSKKPEELPVQAGPSNGGVVVVGDKASAEVAREESSSSSEDEPELDDGTVKRSRVLDAEGLALGSLLLRSSKTRRDLEDGAWNRYTNNDDDLPAWFAADEKLHFRKPLPVSRKTVEEYAKKGDGVGVRGIRKVVEAKARKRKREQRRVEKTRKKANNIADNPDLGSREKVAELKRIYKAAKAKTKKPDIPYVVAKKGAASGKKVRRPPGVKGRFKVVDPRMKKEVRAAQNKERKAKGKGGKHGGKNTKAKFGHKKK